MRIEYRDYGGAKQAAADKGKSDTGYELNVQAMLLATERVRQNQRREAE